MVFSLVRLQIFQGDSLKKAAVDQQLKDTQIVAKRGTIYDANDKVLAQSASVWKVVIEPYYLLEQERDSEPSFPQVGSFTVCHLHHLWPRALILSVLVSPHFVHRYRP